MDSPPDHKVTIGLVVDSKEMQERLHEQLGRGNVQPVVMGSPCDFMAGKVPSVDTFAMLAEAGAAWSILYPAISAVVPQPNPVAFPVGVAVRRGAQVSKPRWSVLHDVLGWGKAADAAAAQGTRH